MSGELKPFAWCLRRKNGKVELNDCCIADDPNELAEHAESIGCEVVPVYLRTPAPVEVTEAQIMAVYDAEIRRGGSADSIILRTVRAALIAALTPAPSVAESIAVMIKTVGGTVAHINDENHPKPPWESNHSPEAGKKVELCTWKEDEDGIYDGTCGVRWYFDCGDVKENGCNFCPKCGKPVRVDLTPAGRGGEGES